MKTGIQQLSIGSALGAAFVAIGMLCSTSASAQDRTITVIGNGSASAAANKVSLQLTVTSQDQTATALFVKQNDVVQRLRKALESAGVKSQDISEQPFRLMPNYEYGQSGQRIIGYRVETPMELEVEDIRSLPRLIDMAAQGGASAVSVGSFSMGSGRSLHADAVKSALADARKEAEMLAKEMGRSLGDVLSITEMEDEPNKAATRGGEEEEEERERERAKSPAQQQTLSEKAELKVVYQIR